MLNENVGFSDGGAGRKRISLYFCPKVYLAFRRACEQQRISPSKVTEELFKRFIAEVAISGTTPRKDTA